MTPASIPERVDDDGGEGRARSVPFSRGRTDAPSRDFGLIGVLNAVMRRRVLVISLALLVAVPTLVVVLLGGRSFTSDAAFTVDSRRQPSNLSGLAAQLGIAMPAGEANQSPDFFVALLSSRTILTAVAESTFTFHKHGEPIRATLLDELVPDHDLPHGIRLERGLRLLRRRMTADVDTKTGLVTLSVRTASPDLSPQVLTRLFAELNHFNLEQRQSHSAAERRFTEAQMQAARRDLRGAEDSLQAFLQQNRALTSPDLTFREQRMSREVARRQQLYTALSQAFDQARMDEVRDTPALTIVEPPATPITPDPRGALTKTVLAFALGLATGVALALLLELSNGVARGDEVTELSELWRATLNDLRHPLRAAARTFRR